MTLKRKFRIRLPVQFRDIDVAGHVNHATYFQYMETARVEFLRSMGQIDIFHPRMILASAHCEYYRPIIKERRITVTVFVGRIGNRSWDFDYTIESPNLLHAKGRTTQVAYDYETRLPTQITKELRKKLEEHSGKPLKFKGQY
jgi:acyl-CoA thioester hydrolase